MRNLLQGNSCAQGCLVYLVTLVLIVAFTGIGLGDLSRRLGAGTPNEQPQAPAADAAPTSAAVTDTDVADSARMLIIPTPTTAELAPAPPPSRQEAVPQTSQEQQPAQGSQSAQGVGGVREAQGAQGSPPADTKPPGPIAAQSQNGVIMGEASLPFYIVQSGDTLWSIATQFGVSVDALRSTNNVEGNLIHPGQLLYLPPSGQSQSPVGPDPENPAPQPPAGQEPSATPPAMPNTGINKGP